MGNKGLRVGIITGSGPDAGVDFWSKVLAACRARLGSQHHGDLQAPYGLLISNPELGLSMDLNHNREQVWRALESELVLASQRCDVVAIACYTLHAFEHRINDLGLSFEFASLVESLREYVRRAGAGRVGVLSANSPNVCPVCLALRRVGDVEVAADVSAVRKLIHDVKRLGTANEAHVTRLRSLIARFNSQTVVLGCTELPLVQVGGDGREIVDGTVLLAERIAAAHEQRISVQAQRGGVTHG